MSDIDHESVFQIAGVCKGMELRDYFAAKFAEVILSRHLDSNEPFIDVAHYTAIDAYKVADVMMKQRLEGEE